MSNYVKSGLALKPRGLKGEFKVKSFSSFPRFLKGKTIYFLIYDTYTPFVITSSYFRDNCYFITLKDCNTIDSILPFMKNDIYSLQEPDSDLKDGEYYYHELIGLPVVYKGEELGVVSEVLEMPSDAMLRVQTKDKSVLVPFRSEFVLNVSDKIELVDTWGLF